MMDWLDDHPILFVSAITVFSTVACLSVGFICGSLHIYFLR